MNWDSLVKAILQACQNVAWKLLGAALVLIIGKLIIHFIVSRLKKGSFLRNKLKYGERNATVRGFIISFVNIALHVFLAVSVVAILGIPLASIVTVLGSAGVAISLAVQGALGNLASGLMLLVFKPFEVGDYIEAEDKGGTVTELGIFYTTLRTPDNRTVVVPNSSLTTSTLTNYSKEKKRRLDIEVEVAYGSDLEAVKRTVRRVTDRHSDICDDPAPFIRLTEMRDSALCLTLRVWCDSAVFWDLKFNLLEEIYVALGEDGIEIPFNSMDIYLHENRPAGSPKDGIPQPPDRKEDTP
ncbi:MAG: mechanosensitive ion channel family protein [Eubacteriales bacterium]